jgi:hypothetical protein
MVWNIQCTIGDEMAENKTGQAEASPPEGFQIQIDREHFTAHQDEMTGAQIRQVPTPPIGPDRDLFEVGPAHTDVKIEDATVVKIRNGLRFFTAPTHISPGQARR